VFISRNGHLAFTLGYVNVYLSLVALTTFPSLLIDDPCEMIRVPVSQFAQAARCRLDQEKHDG